jgi:hypothetical protein
MNDAIGVRVTSAVDPRPGASENLRRCEVESHGVGVG